MRLHPVAGMLCMVFLSACTTTAQNQKPGVVATGFAPYSDASRSVDPILISGMGEGLVGSIPGPRLTRDQRKFALEAEYKALEYAPGGSPVLWKSPDGTIAGEVVAGQPYRVGSQDCRAYSHSLFAGSAQRTGRGTACRNVDGTWTPLT